MGEINRIGVVGGGLMGSGIAEVCAKAGLDVLVSEVDTAAAEAPAPAAPACRREPRRYGARRRG